MPRVTPDEVLQIIDTDVTPLDPFITAAHLLVDEHLAPGWAHGEAMLKEIERWLSAHFVAVRDPRLRSESAGGAASSYEGSAAESDRGLKSTRYGQQALALDMTGRLAQLTGFRGVEIVAL